MTRRPGHLRCVLLEKESLLIIPNTVPRQFVYCLFEDSKGAGVAQINFVMVGKQ